jgi:hypothetical protein
VTAKTHQAVQDKQGQTKLDKTAKTSQLMVVAAAVAVVVVATVAL